MGNINRLLAFFLVILNFNYLQAKSNTQPKRVIAAQNAKKEQGCAIQARRAILQNSQQSAENTDTDATFEFFNGAIVGDAGSAVEIDVYNNKKTNHLIKVELGAEMCTLRSIEYLGD